MFPKTIPALKVTPSDATHLAETQVCCAVMDESRHLLLGMVGGEDHNMMDQFTQKIMALVEKTWMHLLQTNDALQEVTKSTLQHRLSKCIL